MVDDPACLSSPAALRNAEPILAVLRRLLPVHGLVLEVASGSGEHALHFARALPEVQWQPSDADPAALASIAAWAALQGPPNLRPAVLLDAADPARWPLRHADAVLAVNLIHIAPWAATIGLLAGAAAVLPPGGRLILYGAYREVDRPAAPSNEWFDADLNMRDARWGLRQLEDVVAEAGRHGMTFLERIEMPANNLVVVFESARPAVLP